MTEMIRVYAGDYSWYVTIDPPITLRAGDVLSFEYDQVVVRRNEEVVAVRNIIPEQRGCAQ